MDRVLMTGKWNKLIFTWHRVRVLTALQHPPLLPPIPLFPFPWGLGLQNSLWEEYGYFQEQLNLPETNWFLYQDKIKVVATQNGQVDELLIMLRLLDEFVNKIISIIIAVCILIALNFMFFNILNKRNLWCIYLSKTTLLVVNDFFCILFCKEQFSDVEIDKSFSFNQNLNNPVLPFPSRPEDLCRITPYKELLTEARLLSYKAS